MKHFFSKLSLLSAALLLAGNAYAQRTGSYDTTINFMGAQRAVSVYVPPTYNPANPYKLMIGLHGLGDTCNAYRNALITSLGWGTGLTNTIFVFPESFNKNADYYEPAGSGNEAIIAQSVQFARTAYNIDTTEMILQGFSLGGRAALRYGLNNPQMFKGLLLNTPAIQGVKEALNGPRHPLSAPYPLAYANASQVPIYIVNGDGDPLYMPPIDSAYEQLARNNGMIRHLLIAGMGHSVPNLTTMGDFSGFFSTPAHAGADAEAVRFYTPELNHCTAPVTAKLLVHNAGQTPITSIRYVLNWPSSQAVTWTGTIPPFGYAEIPVTFTALAQGSNAVNVYIDSLNGSTADTVTGNNMAEATLYYQDVPDMMFSEGFEGPNFPPPHWALEPAGDAYSVWAQDNTVARTGQNSAGAFNTILLFDNAGRKEKLVTPLLNLTLNTLVFQFDVAYNYHQYTPPYFAGNTDFADTLEVEISTDCGATYQSLYKKGGAQLATFPSPIQNPLDINSCFIAPDTTQWRTEMISLHGIVGSTGAPVPALFRFVYTSALGGSINIDNVATMITTAVKPTAGIKAISLYPNPATETVTVSGAMGINLSVVNSLGQTVLREKAETDAHTLHISTLPAGLYQVLISDGGAVVGSKRLVKE